MSDQQSRPERGQPVQTPKPPFNLLKWGLGCTGVGMLVIAGSIMLLLILTPVVFRSLPPRYQEASIRRARFLASLLSPQQFRAMSPDLQEAIVNAAPQMSAYLPTRAYAPDTLPTVAATIDMSLLNGPVASPTLLPTPTPGQSVLSTDTPTAVNNSAISPTPVIGGLTDTPTLVPTAASVTNASTPIPTTYALPAAFHADGFIWEPQEWNGCGPANLTQALHYNGWQGTQHQAAQWLKPNLQDKNVSPWQMASFVNTQTDYKAVVRVAGDMTLLKRLVLQHLSVIIETGFNVAGEGWMGHYLTVVGWDDSQRILYGFDTYLGIGSDKMGMHEDYDDIDKRWQQFNRVYVIVFPKSRETEVAVLLGSDADLTYNAQHALTVAKTEASSQPDNPFAWFNMGSSYVLLGDYDKAARAYDTSRSVGGGLPWRMLWYQFGSYEAYYNTGNFAQVLADVKTNLVSTTDVEETYYWRGMVEAAQGKTSDAVTDFKHVLDFNPNFSLATDKLTEVQNGTFTPPVTAKVSQ